MKQNRGYTMAHMRRGSGERFASVLLYSLWRTTTQARQIAMLHRKEVRWEVSDKASGSSMVDVALLTPSRSCTMCTLDQRVCGPDFPTRTSFADSWWPNAWTGGNGNVCPNAPRAVRDFAVCTSPVSLVGHHPRGRHAESERLRVRRCWAMDVAVGNSAATARCLGAASMPVATTGGIWFWMPHVACGMRVWLSCPTGVATVGNSDAGACARAGVWLHVPAFGGLPPRGIPPSSLRV